MRVLFVSQEFPPETDWGGIGTYAGVIARALARRGVEVHVLSVVAGQKASDSSADGVAVHRRPLRRPRGVGRLTRLPETWDRVSLAAAVRREQRRLGLAFDVCESPEWRAEGLGLALAGGIPMVVRLHSGASQLLSYYQRPGLDSRLAVRCESSLIRRAAVVTGMEWLLEEVGSQLSLDQRGLRAILNPVEPVEPLPPAEGDRILFAGRLEPRKGPEILVRAAPLILARKPEARFVLVGADAGGPEGGSYADWLRDLARNLGVAERIEIRGRVGGPQAVARELRDAAVCVVPSRWENMPYVPAEAAALGRPVVATRIPGLEQLVDDGVTGRLVQGEEPGPWAEAILSVLDQNREERERSGQAAARLISARCDPGRIAAETIEAYELAISRAGSG